MPTDDLTTQYDYARLIEEEKREYDGWEPTADLKIGGPHSLPAWAYYWENLTTLRNSGFADIALVLAKHFAGLRRPVRMLSLASGFCGNDLDLARRMTIPYRLTCTDINDNLFDRPRKAAKDEGLTVDFLEADLNFILIDKGRYDFIYGYAAIHHVINLEILFDRVRAGLTDRGMFHMVEVIGKKQRLIWPENERFVNALLAGLPSIFGEGAKIFVHDEYPGMEGVRQDAIMGVVGERFDPIFEHRHGAFIRYICTDPAFQNAIDPADDEKRKVLDFLCQTDEAAVRLGVLRPLEAWGIYTPKR